jgi:hypothetical protein
MPVEPTPLIKGVVNPRAMIFARPRRNSAYGIQFRRYRAHRPHPEEAALFRAAVSKDGRGHDLACGRPSRRAHPSTSALRNALLMTRLMDDIDMIRTSETRY